MAWCWLLMTGSANGFLLGSSEHMCRANGDWSLLPLDQFPGPTHHLQTLHPWEGAQGHPLSYQIGSPHYATSAPSVLFIPSLAALIEL